MKSTLWASLAILPLTFVAGVSFAADAANTLRPHVSAMPASVLMAQANVAPAPESAGEVRRIDKSNSKITLRHGPIKNLDMPAMTMVFQVREPALLEALKVGDKVRFSTESVNGAYFVTHIVPAP